MRITIPTAITIARILATVAIVAAFSILPRPLSDWTATVLFLFAAVSDFVDGYLARRLNQESNLGRMLDPVADKALVIVALAMVIAHSEWRQWLLAPASAIIIREILVSGLREFLGDRASALRVTKLAKWKTAIQLIALAALLVAGGFEAIMAGGPSSGGALKELSEYVGNWTGLFGVVLIWFAGALALFTGFDYFVKALPYLDDGANGD